MEHKDLSARGFQALEAWLWHEARAAFEESLLHEETPEALEGLGAAASWLDDVQSAIQARERAYRLFRDRGDQEAAARVAAALADALLTFRGDSAVAAGWLQRARHCLRDHPDSPIMAFVDVLEAFSAMSYERDVARALTLGEAALARSRELGNVDMEMVALAVLGVIVVSSGRLTEGMRMLDEATAAAMAGDMQDPQAAANVCCALVTASVRVRDLDRLAQWSRHAMDISRGWINHAMFNYPRTEHAVALMWWGRWQEAERELLGVIEDTEGRPFLAALAMLRLADLRRRQGRLDEARGLLQRLDGSATGIGWGRLADAVKASVELDEDNLATAADLAERYLRSVPRDDVVERSDGLEVLARSAAALGDVDRAAQAAGELAATADKIATGPLRAAARSAAAAVASARNDFSAARTAQEEAVDLYDRSGAPFEAARARVELARSLVALGLADLAAEEAGRALSTLQALGAVRDAEGAADLSATLARGSRQRRDDSLTPRELEVLQLLASGRSNEEIADALVLSVRTVERHISNIYSKIGAYGRTARAVATAYAHTHALT